MVQGTQLIKIALGRAIGLLAVLLLGIFTARPFFDFIENTGYQSTGGFFVFSLGSWELAWVLSFVFWAGIIFGAAGKKIDYVLFALVFALALWDYSFPSPVSSQIYLGLIGVGVIGVTIGFLLKIARTRFFRKGSLLAR